MKIAIPFFLFLLSFASYAQREGYPTEFLKKEFHQNKRAELRASLPDNSVAVFFSNPVRNRANDVQYVYHQDPDFYYLTGYRESGSLLLVFKEKQLGADGKSYDEVIFSKSNNNRRATYDGSVLGVEGLKKLGFDLVYDAGEFKDMELDFSKFDKVLFFGFKNDVRDSKRNEADLYSLMVQFKTKANYPVNYNSDKYAIYAFITSPGYLENPKHKNVLERYLEYYPEAKGDIKIEEALAAVTVEEKKIIAASIQNESNLDTQTLGRTMAKLREVKTEEEINLLRKAVDISCIGQREVMKAMHPKMSETEIQGIHEFVFKKYGAEFEGYPSIVGAGHNGCILHYINNDKLNVNDDLVLMDLGAEYRGYTADVTRTIPANGKFSKEEKAIYNLVLKSQEEGFLNCKPGNMIGDNTKICREVVNQGLVDLGIIKSIDQKHNYFPHGVSHHIGLDVHDRGMYEAFEENMVLTVEPGIYITEGSDCDPKWWGIAVRIEDDILITKDGYELLSDKAPRTVDEIEKLMKEESIFGDYVLPALD
jgi:Xaa-Pro aminopeptidase